MSTTTNGIISIEDVALPQNNTNFGKNFKNMVDAIDTNFKSLQDQGGIYRGATGSTPSIANISLFEEVVEGTDTVWYLTDTGWEVLECIFRSTEKYSLDSSYKYLVTDVGVSIKNWNDVKSIINSDYPTVNSISATDFFEDSNGNPDTFWPMWAYLDDYNEYKYSPCSPFAFYDPRTAELTSDDDVFLYEGESNTSFVDTSCVLIGYLDTTTGSLNISTTYLFPTLYYDLNATNNDSTTEGAWCWMMNGRMTGIVAEGIPGSPAEARIHLITTSTDITNTVTYKYLYNGVWYDKTEYDQLVEVSDGAVGWLLVSGNDTTDYEDYNAISHEIYVVQWNSDTNSWETTSSTSPVTIDYNTDFFNYIWTPIAKTWASKYTDYLTYVNNMKGVYGATGVENNIIVTPLKVYDGMVSCLEATVLYMDSEYYIYVDDTIGEVNISEYGNIHIIPESGSNSDNTNNIPSLTLDGDLKHNTWNKIKFSQGDTTGTITITNEDSTKTVLIVKNNNYVEGGSEYTGTEYYKLYTILYGDDNMFIDKTEYTKLYDPYSFTYPIGDQSVVYVKDSGVLKESHIFYSIDASGNYTTIGKVSADETSTYYYDDVSGTFKVNGVETKYKEFPANDWDSVSSVLNLPTEGKHIYKVESSLLTDYKSNFYVYDAADSSWEEKSEENFKSYNCIPRTYLPDAVKSVEYEDVLSTLYLNGSSVMEYKLNSELNSSLPCLPLYTILKSTDDNGNDVYEEQLAYAIRTVSSTDDNNYTVKIEKDAAYKYGTNDKSTYTHNIEISDFDNIYYNKPDGTVLNLRDMFNEYDVICNNYVDINKYISNAKGEVSDGLYKYTYIHSNSYLSSDEYEGSYWKISYEDKYTKDKNTFKSIIGNESLTITVGGDAEGGVLYNNSQSIINDLNIDYIATGLNCLFRNTNYINNVNINIDTNIDADGNVENWTYLDEVSELNDVIFNININNITSTFDIVDNSGKALFFNCKSMENCKIVFNIASIDDIKKYNIFGNYNFNRLFYNCYDNKGRITYDRFNVGDTTNSVYFKDNDGNLYDIYTYNITLSEPDYNVGSDETYNNVLGDTFNIDVDVSNVIFFDSDFKITTLLSHIVEDSETGVWDVNEDCNYGVIKYYAILELAENSRLINAGCNLLLDSISYIEFPKHIVDTTQLSNAYLVQPWGYDHWFDGWHYLKEIDNVVLKTPCSTQGMFRECISLESITITLDNNYNDYMHNVSDEIFYNCISLREVALPRNFIKFISSDTTNFYGTLLLEIDDAAECYDAGIFKGKPYSIARECLLYDGDITNSINTYGLDASTDSLNIRDVFYVKWSENSTEPTFNDSYITETDLDGNVLNIDTENEENSVYNRFKYFKFFKPINVESVITHNISDIISASDSATTMRLTSIVVPYDWYGVDGGYTALSVAHKNTTITEVPDFSGMFTSFSYLESVVMYRYGSVDDPNCVCASEAFYGCPNINKLYLPDYLQDPYRGQSKDVCLDVDGKYLDYLMFTK